MDFIASLNIYIAELKALGDEEELALADNLQNCVKEYLDDDQTSDLIKHEGEVIEIGEIIGEEEGELSIKEEEEGELLIKEEVCSNDDSKANRFLTMQKISEQGNHNYKFSCNNCQKEFTSIIKFTDH